MKTANQIANELTPHITANNAAIAPTNRRLARIGDGNGNVQPPTLLMPREVFYRSSLDANDRGVAILAQTCPIPIEIVQSYYNTEVWIANVPGSSQVEIVDIADAGGLTTGAASPSQALARLAAFPSQDRFLILRLRPSVGGGIAVYVDGGPDAISYEVPGGYAFYHSTDFGFPDPTDGSVFIPTDTALASGEHRLVGIALNPATGGLIAIPGPAVTAADTLPSRSEFLEGDYTAIDFTGYYPAGYTYNWYGQTDITEDDCLRLYDPRVFLNKMGGAGNQIIEVDNVPQTPRRALDLVAGTNVTLTPTDDPIDDRLTVLIDAAGGTDVNAIHVNVANEISGLTAKATPVSADLLIIEDSAASGVKKKITLGSLPGATSPVVVTKQSLYSEVVLYDNVLGSAGTWDVTSIDQTYDHLRIIIHGRSAASVSNGNIQLSFNNDTTNSHYLYVELYSDSGGPAGDAGNLRVTGNVPGGTAPSGRFGSAEIFIPAYTDAEHKTVTTMDNSPYATGNGYILARSLTWLDTSAINRISVDTGESPDTFAAGSRLQIIGVKVVDVVTAVTGTTRAGRTATATNYTMLPADVIVGVTDTTSARTITLPAASTVVAGLPYWVKDESGGAATHNITYQRAGSDTVDGGTSGVISSNYGKAALYSDGVSAWFTI